MSRQLIGWALSIAVAVAASGNPALAAGGAAGGGTSGGGAASGGGSTAGSNAGTHMGSNEGTHMGSNQGTTVGSQDPASAQKTAQQQANDANGNNTHVNNPNRVPGIGPFPGTTIVPGNDGLIVGNGVIVGGDTGTGTTTNVPAGTTPSNVTTGTTGLPINAGPAPANGTTPAPSGPITGNGALTTANVPPPASATNNPTAAATAGAVSRQGQIEGQLVDLLSASQEIGSGAVSPASSGGTAAAVSSSVGSSNTSGAAARPATAIPEGGATSASTGSTEATASVRTTGSDTFGTYDRRGATRAPEPPTVSSSQDLPASPSSKGGQPQALANTSIIIGNDSKSNPSGSTTPAPRVFDNTTISRQLTSGMPAAIMANGQMYVLACDPKQLSSYAGQTVRVSGRINSNGSLIPERLEVRQPSGFREITLSKPDMPTATAQDR